MIEVDNALKKLKEAVEKDQLSSAVVPQDCGSGVPIKYPISNSRKENFEYHYWQIATSKKQVCWPYIYNLYHFLKWAQQYKINYF